MQSLSIKISKNRFFFVLIIFVPLLFLIPLFHPGLPMTHDGQNHVARIPAYYRALFDGQIPPRWAGNLNFNYGSPIFVFFYPLPSLLGAVFHLLGFHFEDAFKLVIGMSFIAAPLSFYFWIASFLKKEIAFIGALLYGLAPYHFLDLYVRGDVGELLAFVFIPLILLCIDNMILKKSINALLLGGIFYALLMLSHNGISLMFSPILLAYGLVKSRKIADFFKVFSIFSIGLVASSFYWFPALYEGKYVNAKLFIGEMFSSHFPTLLQLVYSPWGYGSEVRKPGGLSPQIGIALLLFVFLSCWMLLERQKYTKDIIFWCIIFFLSLFISLPISTLLWKNIALLRLFEFPWRFVALASFSASVLACFVLATVETKKLLLAVFFLIIFIAFPMAQVKGYDRQEDSFYEHFSGTTYYHGEASSIWTAGDAGAYPRSAIALIGGKGILSGLKKQSQLHTFKINARSAVALLDNTVYFPGWRVLIDGKQVPIQFQDPNHRGLITFQVPQGTHQIVVSFSETADRLLSDILSLMSFVTILFILMVKNTQLLIE